MSENFKKQVERPDRVLGDEWADWDGKSSEEAVSGPWLFVSFCGAVVLLIDAVLVFLYYMSLPRLHEFGAVFPKLVLFFILIWGVVSAVLFVQLFLTVMFKRNFFLGKKHVFVVFDIVFTRVFKLSRLCRISRDKMGYSFVMVSNAVVKAIHRTLAEKRLMILLPRCLSKEVLQEVYKLKEIYPVEIFTVSGGELARKKVKEYNPSAIIGVACERDLVSGIRDVGHKIPVVGIPNSRPNGPCKDTVIDIGELKRAVEFYLR